MCGSACRQNSSHVNKVCDCSSCLLVYLLFYALCVRVYACVCVHEWVYMRGCACVGVHAWVFMWVCMWVCMHACVHMCMHVCECVCVHVCVCVCVCVYVCKSVCGCKSVGSKIASVCQRVWVACEEFWRHADPHTN